MELLVIQLDPEPVHARVIEYVGWDPFRTSVEMKRFRDVRKFLLIEEINGRSQRTKTVRCDEFLKEHADDLVGVEPDVWYPWTMCECEEGYSAEFKKRTVRGSTWRKIYAATALACFLAVAAYAAIRF